jgi:hypothetical protein
MLQRRQRSAQFRILFRQRPELLEKMAPAPACADRPREKLSLKSGKTRTASSSRLWFVSSSDSTALHLRTNCEEALRLVCGLLLS